MKVFKKKCDFSGIANAAAGDWQSDVLVSGARLDLFHCSLLF